MATNKRRMRQWDHSSTPPTARNRQHVRSRQAVPDFRKSNDDDKSRYRSMRIRIYSSFCMLASVIVIIYLGHLYICAMVIFIQIFMIRELFNLCVREQEEKHLPGFRLLNWHFFFTTMLFVYGRILSGHLVKTVTSDKFFYGLFTRCHMAICYFLYTIGYVGFILTLNQRNLKYQYVQYAWTHTFLIVVFAQSSFTIASIFDGIFWFLIPASLIAINDISTYFFGFFLGRTPLIKLSPKKTWEGFIGALITTMVSAFILANILGQFQWMTCPREDLSTSWLLCDPGPLFKPEYYPLSQWLPLWFPWKNLAVLPVQWHALWLSLFASVIAPFGGFFASGFKRAFEIEDFGASIPGHGGFTDRMACQLLMAIFSYIYYRSFVASPEYSVETMAEEILNNLSFEKQKTLHFSLGQMVRQRQFNII